jgi:hypothetical protein
MKGFLLDTNVPSEMTRPRPQSSVSEWLDTADDDQLYFSVVSLGEILKGITILPESKRRSGLEHFHFWCIQSDQSRRGFSPRKAALLHTCLYRVEVKML